jgi:hypothetical protein
VATDRQVARLLSVAEPFGCPRRFDQADHNYRGEHPVQITKRIASMAAGGVLLTGAVLGFGAGPASAAPSVTFSESPNGNGTTIYAYINGQFAGDGKWHQDPSGAQTGDTVCAEDGTGDGYYIRAELAVGVSANTKGDPAPAVHCNTQNLPEGHTFNMRVCVVKSEPICSRWYSVTA